MIYKVPSNQSGYVRVVFELPSCVWADRIFVSGSFNDWSQTQMPMLQDRDGVWRAVIELPAGQAHEFRYFIDGRWQTDYHADGFTDNNFGSHNSVIDLTLVMALPTGARFSSQVPDGQVSSVPHLPAQVDSGVTSNRSRTHLPAEMPRLRPRVAAA
jgi:hypothetical protein